MGEPRKFCCCFSLRTGTILIGLLYMIGTLLSIAVLALAIGLRLQLPEVNSTPFLEVFPAYFIFSGLGLQPRVGVIYVFVHACVQLIIDITLIVGAAKHKASLAVPWLVLNILSLLSNLLGIIAFCVGGYPSSPIAPYYFGLITPLVVSFFYLAVGIYSIDVVNSFHESFIHRYLRI